MLLTIRKKSQGWVAWLIVVIITIPFALFGINSYFEGINQVTVAKVDGEKINAQAFENTMEQWRRNFRSQLGNDFDPALVDNPQFRMRVVEGLVADRLIQGYAREQGLRLSDKALRERIVNDPRFQSDGSFDPEAYRRVVSARGYSTEGYEQQQRVMGGIEQFRNGLAESAIVNPVEVDNLLALTLQRRDAEYAVIAASDALADVEVSEAEKQAEYEQNPSAYQQPDRVRLDYVTLSLDDIAEEIQLDDEEVEQAYEASKGQYLKPETRIASHILLTVPRSADEATQNQVRERAEEVLARIRGGEDFAELAAEVSEDPGSKRKGGDLGIIARGQMVPEFEEAVYSMNQGDISEPVRTEFGYHIIKLDALEPESQRPLEEVRDEVARAEQTRLAQTQFADAAETFRTLVFEEPDNLVAAAEALGLEVRTSDWITRDRGAGDFSNPRVRSAAFDSVVIDDELNSEVVEVDQDRLIAMRKNEFEPQHLKAYAEVEAEIETLLQQRAAAELARTRGEALIDELKQGVSPEELSFNPLPALRSEATQPVERQVAAEVFSQQLDGGEPLVAGLSLNNGDYAVYRLNSVTPGDPSMATEAQRQQIRAQLASRDSNTAYGLFNEALRNSADVEIFTSLLEDDSDILAAQ